MTLVRNLTPFDLVVSHERYGAPAVDAASFATVEVPPNGAADRVYVQLRGGDLEWPIGMLWTRDPASTLAVTIADLRSNSNASEAFTRRRTFVNGTEQSVDISTGRDDAPHLSTLLPGGTYVNDFPNAEVWIVRSAFSNEVVTAFVDGGDREDPALRDVTYTITDEYREALAEHAPLPSPLPGNRPVALITAKRELRPKEDRSYITTEVKEGPVRPTFNGQVDVVPRRVKVVGAKLIWDANEDKYGLMSLQGDKTLDLERLEMVADEVIIRSPLRMPGTNVTITARRVEFVYDGRIDTSPPRVPPVVHVGPKDKFPKAYTAKDGVAGLPGGSVTLFAHTVITGGTEKVRICTRGGPGDAAEPGGLLAYVRKPTHAPNTEAPENTPDRTVICKSDIARKLPEWFGTVTTAQNIDGWLWPGRTTDPLTCQFDGQPLGFGESPNKRVTSLVVMAHDDRWYAQDTNWFWFPEGGRDQRNLVFSTGRFARPDGAGLGPRPVPGDGQDAYPGGQPGNGGNAGALVTAPDLATLLAPVSDTRGGDAGPPTKAMDGGPAGTPEVALLVDMTIARNDSAAREPQMWVDTYRAEPGRRADERLAQAGKDGEVAAGGGTWVRVETIDAVLSFARAAFRDGHRDEARRAIEPYYVVLRSPMLARRPQYAAAIISLSTMRENLLANLDYYGNPPGWLPRLRVSTNLKLFDTVRKASYQLLYYATTTEQKFDDLQHRSELVGEVRSALESESAACRKAIAEATDLLASSRLELATIANELGERQQALDKLKGYAEQEALSAAEKQRIFKGVMQVVGGAMKAVPVGQPYLGAGGDLVGGIGEVDFFTSDKGADQAAAVLDKLGKATDSFLEDNTDVLAAKLTSRLRREVKLGKKDVKSLSDQVTQAEGEASQVEANIAEYTTPIENQRLADLEARRTKVAVNREAVEQAIAEFQSGERPEEIEPVAGPKTEAETSLDRDLLNLTSDLRAVDAEMTALTAADQAKNAKRLVRLRLQNVALTDAKVRAEKLQGEKAKAELQVEETEAKADDKQERYTEVMGRLKDMGKGISGIGGAIATLATPISKDDKTVQKLAANLLKTKDPQQYQQVMKDMEALGTRQSAAIEKLLKAQSIINSNVARMAESLTAQNNLGRQLHNMDNALDVRAKQYLRGMRQRAEEMFHSSMYHLVMSYRYEALEDLPDSFVNYDRIASALQQLDRVSAGDDAKAAKASDLGAAIQKLSVDMANPTEKDLERIDELVLDFEFLKLGVDIADKRQHRALESRTNVARLALRQDQLIELSRLDAITFNLVEDFGQGADFTWADARIADLTLTELRIDSPDRIVNMRVEFTHSGESIVNSPTSTGEPVYYYFRAAETDDPIGWNFGTITTRTPKAGKPDDITTEIKADSKPDVEEFLARALESADVEFNEYWPSLFSDITLEVDAGSRANVAAITDLVFEVKYTKRQSRGASR